MGWEALDPLPGKGGTTPNSCVDARVNLALPRSNAALARGAMGRARVKGVNGKGVKIKDLDRGK
jgi:hypothetical protein